MESLIFKDCLLLTDIDGTSTGANQQIPQRNLDAVRRFCRLGGRFAFATGRTPKTATKLLRQLEPNAPCVFFNGAEIYDNDSDQVLAQTFLPAEADAQLNEYFERYPECGALIFTPEGILTARPNIYIEEHDQITGISSTVIDWADLPADKYKVLLTAPEETITEMQDYEAAHPSEYTETCRSWPQYFEFLPKGANKGTALVKLRELLGIAPERSFAIGDFDNDLAMLEAAGVSAAPANAVEEAKRIADVVVCDCEEGALADFLDYIEHHIL